MKILATLCLFLFANGFLFANSAIFTVSEGSNAALIPVLYDYPTGIAEDLGIKVYCYHTDQSLFFDITVPKTKGFLPKASNVRDGQTLWLEHGVEIFIQPQGGALYQFIINTAGTVWDANYGANDSLAWNSRLKTKATISDSDWKLAVELPFSDIGVDHANEGMTFHFNMVVRSQINQKEIVHTAAKAEPPRFAVPANFAILKLGERNKKLVNDAAFDFLIKDNVPALKYTLKMSDGQILENHINAVGEFIWLDLKLEEVFSLPLKFKNPFAPVFYIKRIGNDGLIFKLDNSELLSKYVDKMTLTIDDRQFDIEPVQSDVVLPMNSKQMTPGNHLAKLSFYKSNQKLPFESTKSFVSIDETPLEFDLKKIDVSKYFSPVLDNFPDVDAALSSFSFGACGLVKSIKTCGWELMDSPAKIFVDNKSIECEAQKTDAHKNAVLFSGRTDGFSISGSIEFDGLVWYEAELSIKENTSYLELPLKFPDNSRIYLNSGVWSEILTEGKTYLSLMTLFQVTDGIRGLCIYMPPRAADLNLEQYDKIVEINRQGSNVGIKLHLSDGKMPISSGKLSFGFGLQPFPFRQYDNNANFKYRIARSHSYSYLLSNRPDALPAFASGGTKYMVHHEWWNEHQSYYTILNEKERFRQLLADTHQYNIGYLPYFGFQISEKAPEFNLYYPHIGDGLQYKPYIASLVPPAKSFPVCYASIWGDQWLRGIKEFIKEYPVDGIYMDGTLGLNACFNGSHGHLTKDMRGRFVPYFTTKEKRRFALLLHKMTRGVRPNLIFDQHTDMVSPLSMSLVDVFWIGEQTWAFDSTWKVPVDVYRIVFNGRLYGVPIQQLSNLGYMNFMRDLGVTLLLDSIPRPMEGLGDWQFNTFKLWKIFDDYNLKGEYFVPFYSQNAVYKDGLGKVYISYYDTPDHVVLVVSNYEGLQPITAEIDFNSTPLEASSLAKDLLTNEVFSISSKKLSVPINAGSFRMLHILK